MKFRRFVFCIIQIIGLLNLGLNAQQIHINIQNPDWYLGLKTAVDIVFVNHKGVEYSNNPNSTLPELWTGKYNVIVSGAEQPSKRYIKINAAQKQPGDTVWVHVGVKHKRNWIIKDTALVIPHLVAVTPLYNEGNRIKPGIPIFKDLELIFSDGLKFKLNQYPQIKNYLQLKCSERLENLEDLREVEFIPHKPNRYIVFEYFSKKNIQPLRIDKLSINFAYALKYNGAGRKGYPGENGSSYSRANTGENGTNGDHAGYGGKGFPGENIDVYVSLIDSGDSLCKVKIMAGERVTIFYLQLHNSSVELKLTGGEGGDGGHGGNGGAGGTADSKAGIAAGAGGNGGNGGDGGEGGDGGHARIWLDSFCWKYRDQIISLIGGGNGGRGGSSGGGGSSDASGKAGHYGDSGYSGRKGRNGDAQFILWED